MTKLLLILPKLAILVFLIVAVFFFKDMAEKAEAVAKTQEAPLVVNGVEFMPLKTTDAQQAVAYKNAMLVGIAGCVVYSGFLIFDAKRHKAVGIPPEDSYPSYKES